MSRHVHCAGRVQSGSLLKPEVGWGVCPQEVEVVIYRVAPLPSPRRSPPAALRSSASWLRVPVDFAQRSLGKNQGHAGVVSHDTDNTHTHHVGLKQTHLARVCSCRLTTCAPRRETARKRRTCAIPTQIKRWHDQFPFSTIGKVGVPFLSQLLLPEIMLISRPQKHLHLHAYQSILRRGDADISLHLYIVKYWYGMSACIRKSQPGDP